MLTCQFCKEGDFDELGLEIHLANYCMGDQTPKLNSLAYRKAARQGARPTLLTPRPETVATKQNIVAALEAIK